MIGTFAAFGGQPRCLLIRRELGHIQIGWISRTNKVYQLEYRTSLFATNSWTSFGAPTAGGGSTNWVVELGSGERERYYRVRELP
jgi:hypothetical protein